MIYSLYLLLFSTFYKLFTNVFHFSSSVSLNADKSRSSKPSEIIRKCSSLSDINRLSNNSNMKNEYPEQENLLKFIVNPETLPREIKHLGMHFSFEMKIFKVFFLSIFKSYFDFS